MKRERRNPTHAEWAKPGESATVADYQADQLAEFFAEPPKWFRDQAATIPAELPPRLVNPLANTVVIELFGSPQRWREILPAVEKKLKEMT